MDSQLTHSAVVTGVSSGIGEAITQTLLAGGYRVFGSVRKQADADRLQASLGSMFIPMLFDVRDAESIKQSALMVSEKLNGYPLKALVNNAGLAAFGPMECLDDDTFEDVIAVNLIGVRSVTNAFLPMLRGTDSVVAGEQNTSPGKIINISSLSGILNTPMNGAYCVSKHALESLGEIYRRELRSAGIKVFSIRSGPIQSQIWSKNSADTPQYDNPSYQRMSRNAQGIMQDAAANALPASVIATLVDDIIENRKRKLAYEIGRGAGIAKLLSSRVPVRLADWLIDRALSKPGKPPGR